MQHILGHSQTVVLSLGVSFLGTAGHNYSFRTSTNFGNYYIITKWCLWLYRKKIFFKV